MLKQSGLHISYWAEALSTATYLHNILPFKASPGSTPYELWHKQKPLISHLRVFGVVAYAHVDKHLLKHPKLSDRAVKAIFVGYTEGVKAYRLYDPHRRQIFHSRSVVFMERPAPSSQRDVLSKSLPDDLSSTDDDPIVEFSGAPDHGAMDLDSPPVHQPDTPLQFTDPDIDVPETTSWLPPADMPDNAHSEQTPPDPPTRTLRSRSGITAPKAYSPSDWRTNKSWTDWTTSQVVSEPLQPAPVTCTDQPMGEHFSTRTSVRGDDTEQEHTDALVAILNKHCVEESDLHTHLAMIAT